MSAAHSISAPADSSGTDGERRIGLFTIFRCTNYGAVLQAIALKRVLSRLFPDAAVEVINHWMDARDTHLLGKITNPNTPWFQRWRNRRKFARRVLEPGLFEARRATTISLIERALAPTARVCRSPEAFRDLPPYDVVVVGSDQVWNPGLNHDFHVNPYLCATFPEGQRRVAYAASFGVGALPPACEAEYRAALGRFAAITVREETGAAICAHLLGARPAVTLDPPLLLTADEWRAALAEFGTSPASESGSALVAYWVRRVTQADADALGRFARAKGVARVRLLSAGPMPRLALPPEVEPFIEAGPLDFVRAIATSAGVVTDSFHGLQFAVAFRKPVVALGMLSDPASNASRLVDFARRYGLDAAAQEIESFRSGGVEALADSATLDAVSLERDRAHSLERLREMV